MRGWIGGLVGGRVGRRGFVARAAAKVRMGQDGSTHLHLRCRGARFIMGKENTLHTTQAAVQSHDVLDVQEVHLRQQLLGYENLRLHPSLLHQLERVCELERDYMLEQQGLQVGAVSYEVVHWVQAPRSLFCTAQVLVSNKLYTRQYLRRLLHGFHSAVLSSSTESRDEKHQWFCSQRNILCKHQ